MLRFRKERSMLRALTLSTWVLVSSALPTVQIVRVYFFFQTNVISPSSLSHRVPLSISELLNYCILYFHTMLHLSWSSLPKAIKVLPQMITGSIYFKVRIKKFSSIAINKRLSVLGSCLDERHCLCMIIAMNMQITCWSYKTLSCVCFKHFTKLLLVVE